MRLYFPVDLTGNLIMIEKLVLGEIWTGDLPIWFLKFKQGSKAIPRTTMLLEHGMGMLDRWRGREGLCGLRWGSHIWSEKLIVAIGVNIDKCDPNWFAGPWKSQEEMIYQYKC